MNEDHTFDSSPDASKDNSITSMASMSKRIPEASKEAPKDNSFTSMASMSKLRPILIAKTMHN